MSIAKYTYALLEHVLQIAEDQQRLPKTSDSTSGWVSMLKFNNPNVEFNICNARDMSTGETLQGTLILAPQRDAVNIHFRSLDHKTQWSMRVEKECDALGNPYWSYTPTGKKTHHFDPFTDITGDQIDNRAMYLQTLSNMLHEVHTCMDPTWNNTPASTIIAHQLALVVKECARVYPSQKQGGLEEINSNHNMTFHAFDMDKSSKLAGFTIVWGHIIDAKTKRNTYSVMMMQNQKMMWSAAAHETIDGEFILDMRVHDEGSSKRVAWSDIAYAAKKFQLPMVLDSVQRQVNQVLDRQKEKIQKYAKNINPYSMEQP